MPRATRLDAPLMLHHVIGRGIERRAIFTADDDRRDFLGRIAALVAGDHLAVYAWALMPNHFHLLVCTGNLPLSTAMQILLGGYAGAFNRRHRRSGHLFQNRFKSTLVQHDPYFLELVRYIHLNPVRARLVPNLGALDQYPWTGHAALLGHHQYLWYNSDYVLAQFGTDLAQARARYRAFVADGLAGAPRDMDGGGLRRSRRRFAVMADLTRGREAWTFDERVLGDSDFVEAVLAHVNRGAPLEHPIAQAADWINPLLRRLALHAGLELSELTTNTKRRCVVRVRQALCYLAVCHGGIPARQIGPVLGIDARTVLKAAAHGERALAQLGWSPSALLSPFLTRVR